MIEKFLKHKYLFDFINVTEFCDLKCQIPRLSQDVPYNAHFIINY